jgi:hypothetical protein
VDIARVGTVVTYHKHLSSACLDENSPLGLALIGTLICNSCFPRNMQIIQFFSTDGFTSEKQISLVTLPTALAVGESHLHYSRSLTKPQKVNYQSLKNKINAVFISFLRVFERF